MIKKQFRFRNIINALNFRLIHIKLNDKILFGLGASTSSFIFFFALGYLSKLLSKYLMNIKTQKVINLFIILFMSSLAIYVLGEILRFYM